MRLTDSYRVSIRNAVISGQGLALIYFLYLHMDKKFKNIFMELLDTNAIDNSVPYDKYAFLYALYLHKFTL